MLQQKRGKVTLLHQPFHAAMNLLESETHKRLTVNVFIFQTQRQTTTKNIRVGGQMYLWCCECCCAAHGVLHMGCLNIQSFELVFKFVHES